jgi:hypothetical protein
MRAMDLAELTGSADRIIVGDVLAADAAWDSTHRDIYTTVEIGVREVWKGAAPANGKIGLRHLGGTVGEIEMTVLGEVGFAVGERAVLFLRHAQLVGMAQGKRRVRWDASAKRWLAEAPDRRGNILVPAGQGAAGVQMQVSDESLDVLREKVRVLLGK